MSSIPRCPTLIISSYTGSDLVANVAYDILTSSDCGSIPEYEIMIWLGALGGANPISSSGSPNMTVDIGGTPWDLYQGVKGQATIYTFVAVSQQKDYRGNLNDFFRFLMYNGLRLPGKQCVYYIGAGTEAFTGRNAKFTTTGYNISVTTTGPIGGECALQWGQCGGNGWTGTRCCSIGKCTVINEWHWQCYI
jgi:xyloglucan-specific endo-beta-1,4-glucanase